MFHLNLRYEGVQRVLAPSIVGHGGCQRGLDHPTLGWWQGPHPLPGAKVDRIPGKGISCPFFLPPLPSCPKGPSAFFPFFFTTQSSEKTSFQHNEVILTCPLESLFIMGILGTTSNFLHDTLSVNKSVAKTLHLAFQELLTAWMMTED